MDGKEVKLRGRGNGPLSSLATALKGLAIDVDVNDYTEHAIGEGSRVKAASYVECKFGKQLVWGVGIHEDVVQSSLVAMLSAVSNVSLTMQLTRIYCTDSDAFLQVLASSSSSPPILKPAAVRPANPNGGGSEGTPTIVSVLEEQVNST